MLDPALCSRPVNQWLVLKSTLSQWLTTPPLIILPLLALVFIPWMFPRLRWRRWWSSLGIVLLVIYFSAAFPLTVAVAKQGLVAFIPKDSGKTVDAIVVLGRGGEFRDSRVKVAAQLWQSRRAPLIFASGAGDGSEIVEQLKAQGIPHQALEEEHCSRTTEENALFTASVLQPRGVKQVLIVTDPPHMMRSLLTFGSLGFEAIPHTSSIPPNLTQTKKAMLVFYEYMGLFSYSLGGKFFPQDVARLKKPPIAKIEHSAASPK